jgi:spore maturation protein CgeB
MVCAGGLFVDDLGDALVHRGYCVWRLEAERLAEEDTAAILARFRPALVARINTMQGLADLCERARVPLLVWEIDPVLDGLQSPRRPVPGTWIFTYREQQVRAYRSQGYAHVEHLPLAAPPHRRPLSAEELADPRFLPEDGEGFVAPVSFVGSSMLRQVEGYVSRAKESLCAFLVSRGQAPTQAGALLQQAMEIQRKELDRWVIPGILDASLPGFRDFVRQTQHGIDPAMWLGELVAAERRLSHVRALAPFGVHVWGDPGWGRIVGGGVRYRGYAGHRHQLGRIYCSARINVDIGRLYQQDIVTMRVFDVLACGGFLLAEHSPHLSKLFEIGKELVVWRNQAELVAKVGYYLRNPEEAARIAQAGRSRVLADHQIGQRVQVMLNKMGLFHTKLGDAAPAPGEDAGELPGG